MGSSVAGVRKYEWPREDASSRPTFAERVMQAIAEAGNNHLQGGPAARTARHVSRGAAHGVPVVAVVDVLVVLVVVLVVVVGAVVVVG
jgi:hypothetical protein